MVPDRRAGTIGRSRTRRRWFGLWLELGLRLGGECERRQDDPAPDSNASVASARRSVVVDDGVRDLLALLGRAAPVLAPTADGVAVGHRHADDPLDDALARIVEPFVTELATGDPDRVRVCANDRCAWVFYDESRGGQRRWCEMASCGNRAKAARHRARKKAAETNPAPDAGMPTD